MQYIHSYATQMYKYSELLGLKHFLLLHIII